MVAPLLKRRSSAASVPTCWSAASSARSRCSRSRSVRNAGLTRPPESAGLSCTPVSRMTRHLRPPFQAAFLLQRFPFGWDKFIAAGSFCDVSARGKGEVVRLDQHAVGRDAIKHPAPCFDSLWAIHVEDWLPVGMARKQIRVSHGVAHRQHGLIAGMDGKRRMAGRMAVGRYGFDAGRNLAARFEAPHLAGDVLEDAPRVEEITLHHAFRL